MHGFVAPTDHGWYQFLRARPEISEVNFWSPSGRRFSAIRPGEPFFFKLKAPYNAIGGFGLFARFVALPVWHAWDVFGQANGTRDEHELLERLRRLGRAPHRPHPEPRDRLHRRNRAGVLLARRVGPDPGRLVAQHSVGPDVGPLGGRGAAAVEGLPGACRSPPRWTGGLGA